MYEEECPAGIYGSAANSKGNEERIRQGRLNRILASRGTAKKTTTMEYITGQNSRWQGGAVLGPLTQRMEP